MAEPEFIGVLLVEFDIVVGPALACQCPEGLLPDEGFDCVSDYLITPLQLCGKLITIDALDVRIMGFPVNIDDEKYARNNLQFTTAFVFRPGSDVTPFEPLLRKFAKVLMTIEQEEAILSTPQGRVSSNCCIAHTSAIHLLRTFIVPVCTDSIEAHHRGRLPWTEIQRPLCAPIERETLPCTESHATAVHRSGCERLGCACAHPRFGCHAATGMGLVAARCTWVHQRH